MGIIIISLGTASLPALGGGGGQRIWVGETGLWREGLTGGERDGREGRRSEVKAQDSVIIKTVTSVPLTMCQVPR